MKIVCFVLKSRLFYGFVAFGLLTVAFPFVSGLMQKKSAVVNPLAPAAVNIIATLTDNVSTAQNPGGTITYTATVQNNGTTDATGVAYNHQINSATTLINSSVNVQPIAGNDAYNVAGNVRLVIPGGANGLLSNDTDADGNTLSIPPGNFLTTQNGSITFNADDSFTYEPPRGFSGTDTYVYVVSDNSGASNQTATGTITFTVSTLIWFVNPAAAADGDGTLASPYKNLSTFSTQNTGAGSNPADGDFIFLYSGTHTGGLTLRTNQKVLGQSSPVSILTFTGITAPSGTNQLPGTGGAAATIANGAGSGLTISTDNTINGLAFGNSNASAIIGTNFGALTVANVSINSSGQALNLTTGTLAGTGFTSITSSGGTNNISLTTIAGSLPAVGGALSGATGTAFLVSGGTAAIAYSGTISKTSGGQIINVGTHATGNITLSGNLTCNSGCTGISAAGNTSGAIDFSGGTKTLNTGTGNAVTLSSNTGATINFSNGGLDIDTTSGAGFSATGGGTVSVTTGANPNTIDTTTGTALNVANTNIGASNLTFRSISSNGAANGIVLNNTGASGGLTVTGNGGACTSAANSCTGGAIQSATVGVSLTTTRNVSIDRMYINNTTASGVNGTAVTNFTFTNGKIDNSGTAHGVDNSNIAFNTNQAGATNNLDGNVTITGNTLTNAFYHGVDIYNKRGTVADANISNNTITSANSLANAKGSGIRFIAFGDVSGVPTITKATLNQNTITTIVGPGIQVQCAQAETSSTLPTSCGTFGSATNIIAITNNTIAGFNSTTGRMQVEGIIGLVNGNGQGNFNISGNNVQHTLGIAISSSAFGEANVSETINNNTIVANNTVAAQGIGIGTSSTGFPGLNCGAGQCVGQTPTLTATVNGNNISQVDGNGILAVARDVSGTLNVTIKGNTVAAPLTGVRPGIRVDSGNANGNSTVCADIGGTLAADKNATAGTNTTDAGIGLRRQTTNTNVFGIEGMGATATPGVEQFVDARNTSNPGPPFGDGNGVLLISGTTGFSNCSSAPIAAPVEEAENKTVGNSDNLSFLDTDYNSVSEILATLPLFKQSVAAETIPSVKTRKALIEATPNANGAGYWTTVSNFLGEAFNKLGSAISPIVTAQGKNDNLKLKPTSPTEIDAPEVGETVSKTIGTMPAGKSVTIVYQVKISDPACATTFNTQGTVSGSNFANVLTNDPDTAPANDATATSVNKSTATNSLSLSAATSAAGDSVTLTATVAAQGTNGGCAPTGSVQFKVGGVNFGSPVAISGGTAVLMTRALPIGASSITAEYVGDATFIAINSAAQSHTVNKAATVFVDDSFAGSAEAQDLGGGRIFNRNAFSTIAGGLANVAAAGMVNVAEGVYNENVTLNQDAIVSLAGNVTLTGNLTVSQGTWNSTTGTFAISGNLSQTAGTFNANNGSITFNGGAAQILTTIAAQTFNNLTVNNAAGVSLSLDTTVNGVLTLTNGNLNPGANLLIIGAAGSVSRTSGHVVGRIRKTLANGETFAFPVGTANGYSPVTLSSVVGNGDFTARAVQSAMPGIFNPQKAITRYWNLTNGGITSAVVSFQFLAADIPGTATGANLRIFRDNGGAGAPFSFPDGTNDNVNETANPPTATTLNPITTFSNWSIGESSAPTSASVTVSGRVLTANGRAVSKAVITMVDVQGEIHYALSNSFGYYRFIKVAVGQTVIITAQHKSYQFNPQALTVQDELTDFNLMANP